MNQPLKLKTCNPTNNIRKLYKNLRKLGLNRHDTNLICFGAHTWTQQP